MCCVEKQKESMNESTNISADLYLSICSEGSWLQHPQSSQKILFFSCNSNNKQQQRQQGQDHDGNSDTCLTSLITRPRCVQLFDIIASPQNSRYWRRCMITITPHETETTPAKHPTPNYDLDLTGVSRLGREFWHIRVLKRKG